MVTAGLLVASFLLGVTVGFMAGLLEDWLEARRRR